MSTEEQPKPTTEAAPVEEKPTETKPAEETKPEEKPVVESKTAVYVSNIAPDVTSKTLSDFFGFCGAIKTLVIRPDPTKEDGTQDAAVDFETDSAAKTALILTNAAIGDRAITIVPYVSSMGILEPAAGGDSESGQTGESAEAQKSGSFMDTIVSGGQKIGNGIQKGALEIDEKLKIREKFNTAVAAVQRTWEEQHVVENVKAFGNRASTSLETAGAAIVAGANSVGEAAMKNQYVSSAWGALSSWGSSMAKGWRNLTGMSGDDSGDSAAQPEGEKKEEGGEVKPEEEKKEEGEVKPEEEKKAEAETKTEGEQPVAEEKKPEATA